ncbi:MAG TPA: uroporphyrinogen decarboxylase family protein [Bacteroidota bacterium]|nr:uroporphyrinogen decarboxylase family protein [Bacteroidota bacterium]
MEFTPVVYEHAAKFIGRSPWDVSRDLDLLVEAHAEAWGVYHHTPLVAGIDVYNVEPEAYGAAVGAARENEVPSITGQLCQGAADLCRLDWPDPQKVGRFPMIMETAERLRDRCPGAEIRIPLSGPFSIACALVGFQGILTEVLTDPGTVAAAIRHLALGQVEVCRAMASRGFRVMFFDSAASPPIISGDSFKEEVLPAYCEMIGGCRSLMHESPPLILGGDTTSILEYLIETGTEYLICPAETNGGAFMEIARRHPSVTVRLNTPARLFASNDREALRESVEYLGKLARGHPAAVLGSGVLPYDADPAMVKFAQEIAATL